MKTTLALLLAILPFVLSLGYFFIELRGLRAWDTSWWSRGYRVWEKSWPMASSVAWPESGIREAADLRCFRIGEDTFVFRFVATQTFYGYKLDRPVPVGPLGFGQRQGGVWQVSAYFARGWVLLFGSLAWLALATAGLVTAYVGWEESGVAWGMAIFVTGLLAVVSFTVLNHERGRLENLHLRLMTVCFGQGGPDSGR